MVNAVSGLKEITVRSGGSGDPALEYVAAAFEKETGHVVKITYDNDLAEAEDAVFDVVVAATDALNRQFRPTGRVEPGGIPVGRIGLGVAIRAGAPVPQIGSMDLLIQELQQARAFMVTTHSSGLHLEAAFARLGLFDLIAPKLERFANGPLLMDRLLAGHGKEFAILGMNQIKRYEGRGLVLVGAAPEEVQHYIEFVAVPMAASSRKEIAWDFARFCGGPGKPLLAANGFNQGNATQGPGGPGTIRETTVQDSGRNGIIWDHEADFVVIGSGPGGILGAIAARDKGASVILIEQNFDLGGRAIISGGGTYLGGGTWLQKQSGIEDSPERIIADWTTIGHPLGRYNDRELVWTYAHASVATFDMLTENGVSWARLQKSRLDSVPRRAYPKKWQNQSEIVVWGAGEEGAGLMRPLAASARAKGVQVLLQHKMVTLHRESRDAGRVYGVTAALVDRHFRPTGATVNIRARKGVLLGTGGHSMNVTFRRIFDPRLTEEYGVAGMNWAPKTADGEIAALKINASLWGTANQTNEGDVQLSKGRMGCRSNYHSMPSSPESPHFFREKATGIQVRDYQNLILVKENGKRFYAETESKRDFEYFAAAMQWTGDPAKMNGGGPIWAIFDADGVAREGWNVTAPYVDEDGFFFRADTIEELAAAIQNEFQWRPMPPEALRATIDRYNAFVDGGADLDFGKPAPLHKIQKPPFYAAWSTPCIHDSVAGLRINPDGQVIDLEGQLIPGLYACGDTAGGFAQHGVARSFVFGRLAGLHAAAQGQG